MKFGKIYLTLVLGVLIIALSSAELVITPNPMNITLKVDEQSSFNVTLKNTFDFGIRDFSFTNLSGFSFNQIEIPKNETRELQFTVLRNSPISELILSTVKFNYLVEIPSEPQTHYINITPTGYDPNFLVIHEQDTIIWKNIDDITHTVTSSNFDLNVAPNATVQKIFTEAGTITYQDLVLFFGGTLEVLNRTSQQAVHNPSFDKEWKINLVVTAEPTTLQLENLGGSDFTIESDGTTDGLLKIINNGTNVAQTVSLTSNSDWIKFDENNFDLNVGQQKFVDFSITPLILSTNETNKNYTITIKSSSLNAEESSFDINVFIPFKDVDTTLTEDERLLIIYSKICSENPNAPLCTGVLQSEGNNSATIRDPEVQFNFTTSTILDLLRRQRQSDDSQSRLDNRITNIEGLLSQTLQNINSRTNESLAKQIENERKINDSKNMRWILGFFAILIAGVIYGGYRYKRYNEKRQIAEGAE